MYWGFSYLVLKKEEIGLKFKLLVQSKINNLNWGSWTSYLAGILKVYL